MYHRRSLRIGDRLVGCPAFVCHPRLIAEAERRHLAAPKQRRRLREAVLEYAQEHLQEVERREGRGIGHPGVNQIVLVNTAAKRNPLANIQRHHRLRGALCHGLRFISCPSAKSAKAAHQQDAKETENG
jgi:hypothetical protein